jgi:hypothetical protein
VAGVFGGADVDAVLINGFPSLATFSWRAKNRVIWRAALVIGNLARLAYSGKAQEPLLQFDSAGELPVPPPLPMF